MRFLDHFRTATLLSLGSFILVSAIESACSSPADDGSGTSAIDTDSVAGAKCGAGTKASTVDGVTACCAGSECETPDYLTLGSSCHTLGETAKIDHRSFVRDTCVVDSCSGDLTSETYAATAVHDVGTAVCKSTGGKLAWAWQKTPTEHIVERSCDVVGTLSCGGDGYGGYGGYGDTGYGGYGDGYGYGSSGGRSLHAIVASVDTCTGPDSALCASDHL